MVLDLKKTTTAIGLNPKLGISMDEQIEFDELYQGYEEWLDQVERKMKDATRGFSFSRSDALREHLVEYILRHNGVSAFGVTPIGN